MASTVFYFSGTGNSYYIAKGISEGLSGRLVSMASIINDKEITTDTDCIGMVFPTYYGDAPGIVQEFIPKLKGLSSKYVFVVSNYGGGKGRSVKTVNELLLKNGGELAASYGIHMPQNAFLKPKENAEKLYAKANEMVKLICRRTEEKARGFRVSEKGIDLIQRPITPLIKSLSRNHFIKTVQGSEVETDIELMRRLDCSFNINESCIGCGLCSKICPVHNITMENGKPKWTHRCENCLACYNLCPNKAILSGIAHKDYYYLKPGYTAKAAGSQQAHAD